MARLRPANLLSGRNAFWTDCVVRSVPKSRLAMNGIIYLVGLVVVVLAILSFLGLR
jgi:hypothetical protein